MGFIGHSTNIGKTNQIASALFGASDSRGVDAAGFLTISTSEKHFYKAPISSTAMTFTSWWRKAQDTNPYLLLGHARAATHGDPLDNKNNQPFISGELCLIHNGQVHDYNELKSNYQLESECDSEILLRIFESKGIEALLSIQGPAAVAIVKDQTIWLFRNEGRPLHVIDLREKLGQIFFCSTVDIWLQSRLYHLSENIYPLPTNEVWQLDKNMIVKRFKIEYN